MSSDKLFEPVLVLGIPNLKKSKESNMHETVMTEPTPEDISNETSEILKEILAELKEHSTILSGNTTELQSISQSVKKMKEDVLEIQTTIDRYTKLEKRVELLEKTIPKNAGD